MMPIITSWTQAAWVAIDILLVALLIYQVLVMIRVTRAAPMLVGLVVVAIIFYLARIGELTTLNWVVTNSSIPPLRTGTHHDVLAHNAGTLADSVDGSLPLSTSLTSPSSRASH